MPSDQQLCYVITTVSLVDEENSEFLGLSVGGSFEKLYRERNGGHCLCSVGKKAAGGPRMTHTLAAEQSMDSDQARKMFRKKKKKQKSNTGAAQRTTLRDHFFVLPLFWHTHAPFTFALLIA